MKGATFEDVSQNFTWINRFPWMKLGKSQFSALTLEEITLMNKEINESNKESQIYKDIQTHASQKVNDQVKRRCEFSNYIIDPNRYTFSKVIRILAYVQRFFKNIKRSSKDVTITKAASLTTPTTQETSLAEL